MLVARIICADASTVCARYGSIAQDISFSRLAAVLFRRASRATRLTTTCTATSHRTDTVDCVHGHTHTLTVKANPECDSTTGTTRATSLTVTLRGAATTAASRVNVAADTSNTTTYVTTRDAGIVATACTTVT